jgi:hypothetical protein
LDKVAKRLEEVAAALDVAGLPEDRLTASVILVLGITSFRSMGASKEEVMRVADGAWEVEVVRRSPGDRRKLVRACIEKSCEAKPSMVCGVCSGYLCRNHIGTHYERHEH